MRFPIQLTTQTQLPIRCGDCQIDAWDYGCPERPGLRFVNLWVWERTPDSALCLDFVLQRPDQAEPSVQPFQQIVVGQDYQLRAADDSVLRAPMQSHPVVRRDLRAPPGQHEAEWSHLPSPTIPFQFMRIARAVEPEQPIAHLGDTGLDPALPMRDPPPAAGPEQAGTTGVLEFDQHEAATGSAAAHQITDEVAPEGKFMRDMIGPGRPRR